MILHSVEKCAEQKLLLWMILALEQTRLCTWSENATVKIAHWVFYAEAWRWGLQRAKLPLIHMTMTAMAWVWIPPYVQSRIDKHLHIYRYLLGQQGEFLSDTTCRECLCSIAQHSTFSTLAMLVKSGFMDGCGTRWGPEQPFLLFYWQC